MRADLFNLCKIAQKRGHIAFAEMLKTAILLTPEQEDIMAEGGCVYPLKPEEKKDILVQKISDGELTKEQAEAKLKKVMYCGDYGGKRRPSSNFCQKHHEQLEGKLKRKKNKCITSGCPNDAKEGSLKCEMCLAYEESLSINEKIDKKVNKQKETEQKKLEREMRALQDQVKKVENTRRGRILLDAVDSDLKFFHDYLKHLEKEKTELFSKDEYENLLKQLNGKIHRAENVIMGTSLINKSIVDRLNKLKDMVTAYEARRQVLLVETPMKREVSKRNTPNLLF